MINGYRKNIGIIASFDYGQIDARNIACWSRDKKYCKALWEDYDIHLEWAYELAHYYPAWVGGEKYLKDEKAIEEFRSGKVKNNWVFALFYGAGKRKTAERFGVDENFITKPFNKFWKDFADVKVAQESLLKQFDECGYVQIHDGLRRRAPLSHGMKINTPIQGATNRIIMSAMNRLSEMDIWDLQANMQIHDDLTFAFETEQKFEDNVEIIIDTMLDGSEFPWFCVPLAVDVKIGHNWGEQEKIGTYTSNQRLNWPVRAREFM